MLQRDLTALRIALLVLDGAAAAALFAVASLVRFGAPWTEAWNAAGAPWWVFAAAYGALWIVAEWLQELDQLRARWRLWTEVQDVVRAVALVAVSVFSLLFLVHAPEVSRQFLLMLFAAQVVFSIAQRILLRALLSSMRDRGVGARRVLILGSGERARAFAELLARHASLGFEVIGHLGPAAGDERATSRDAGAPRLLGPLESLEHTLHQHVVDEVVACLEPEDLDALELAASLCLEEGRILRIPLPAGLPAPTTGRVETLDGVEILTIANTPDRVIGLATKRLIDIAIAAVSLVVLAPLLLLVAIAIRVVDGGPVLFRQDRVGLHGRLFPIVKFRTMIPDAEARLADLVDHNEIRGHAFKVQADPRITRLGALLRRASIDELPQLWNVLRGQMSVVGPRPPLPGEVAAYDLWHRRRLSMKPGITGLWQVSARREQEFDRWVELDLTYIDRWSLWLDLKIILRTVPAMLSGR